MQDEPSRRALPGCGNGQLYYNCVIGTQRFNGCCSINPCNPEVAFDQACPDPHTTTAAPAGASTTAKRTDASSASATAAIATTGATAATTTTQAVPSNASSSGAVDPPTRPLNTPAVVGISVGGTVLGIGILVFLILLVRRHKLSKSKPSYRDTLGGGIDEKLRGHNRPSDAGGSPSEADGLAPLGGRAHSSKDHQFDHVTVDEPQQQDAISPAGGAPFVSPMTPMTTGASKSNNAGKLPDTAESKPDGPVQLDSKPLYFELDSSNTVRPAELPTSTSEGSVSAKPEVGGLRSPATWVTHPSLLTPGLPGAMLKGTSAQGQSRLEQNTVQQGDTVHDSSVRLPTAPSAATLSATPQDRQSNRHVTSWENL